MTNRRSSILITLLCLLLSSCAANRMVETDLYFGLNKPDGSRINEQEWNAFRDQQMSRVFEGSTILDATGTWYNPKTKMLITEPSHMVISVYKKSKKQSQRIDSLRDVYKRMFSQESVLRVDKKVTASF